MNRKMLIISEYIAPVNAIASIRWSKLSKYLKLDYGYDIDVLTNEKAFDSKPLFCMHYSTDKTLCSETELFSKIHVIPTPISARFSIALFNLGSSVYSMSRRVGENNVLKDAPEEDGCTSGSQRPERLKSLKAKIVPLLLNTISSSMAKARLPREIDLDAYDVVLSSYGPHWTHQLAARIKKMHPDVMWIADYRDLPAFSESSNTEQNRLFAKKTTGQADCVFVVDDVMPPLLGLPKEQRVETVSNGFDPDELANRSRKASDFFNLVYTGILYDDGAASRDLRPLFKCLSHLISIGVVDRNRIRIQYAGGTGSVFEEQINAFPDLTWQNYGEISRKAALDMQDQASLLLFSTWHTKEFPGGASTGKLFEYFASGVPILGMCSGNAINSPCKTMIETARAGVVYEQANHEKDWSRLLRFVEGKYREWMQTGMTSCQIDQSFINTFNHRNLAKKVDSIIASVETRISGEN